MRQFDLHKNNPVGRRNKTMSSKNTLLVPFRLPTDFSFSLLSSFFVSSSSNNNRIFSPSFISSKQKVFKMFSLFLSYGNAYEYMAEGSMNNRNRIARKNLQSDSQ